MKNVLWNQDEARLRAGWRLAIQIILNLGLALLIWIPVRQVLGLTTRESPWSSVLRYLVLFTATLLSVWLAGRFLDRRRFSDFGLHILQSGWWADLGFGLAVGSIPQIGLALAAAAAGWIELEPAFTSGMAGIPLMIAMLVSLFEYTCVGAFEELARAYHVRNLLEGASAQWIKPKAAMLLAVTGASLVSVVMHVGNPAFLFLVFASAVVNTLCYLLTGRIGIAVGYHIAWDFVLTTLLVVQVYVPETLATLFVVQLDGARQATEDGIQLGLPELLVLLGLETVVLCSILIWVRWRYGEIRLRRELAWPTLRHRSSLVFSQRYDS